MSTKTPHLLKIHQPLDASFVLKGDAIAWDNPWHYHPELELIYCIKGKGTNFIGNAIMSIEEGEILLFGSNLPHTRQRDRSYYKIFPDEIPESIVIQFREDFLGKGFFAISEFSHVYELMAQAQRGIKFTGHERDIVSRKLLSMYDLDKTQRMICLLTILDDLAKSKNRLYLNPGGYVSNVHEKNSRKINKVYEYTITNFRNEISLKEIAALTNLSLSAFCRYFKTRTRKTYFQYLTEVRIGYACRLLSEADKDIKRIAAESGFTNLSHFNKQFRKIMKMAPREYWSKTILKSNFLTA